MMMRTASRRAFVFLGLAGAALCWNLSVTGQTPSTRAARPGQAAGGFVASTKNGDWPSYTGDTRGSRFSPLAQITAANFNDLEVAWRFQTDNLGSRPADQTERTPPATARPL